MKNLITILLFLFILTPCFSLFNFTLSGGIKNYFRYEDFTHYSPYQDEYRINFTYNFKGKVRLYYEHMCSHSIDSYVFRDVYNRFGVRFYFVDK